MVHGLGFKVEAQVISAQGSLFEISDLGWMVKGFGVQGTGCRGFW
jgi:hypothetical protein